MSEEEKAALAAAAAPRTASDARFLSLGAAAATGICAACILLAAFLIGKMGNRAGKRSRDGTPRKEDSPEKVRPFFSGKKGVSL